MGGRLIVFEGVEGGGKTTQMQRISEWLQKRLDKQPVLLTREPGGTQLGIGLRKILLEENHNEPLMDRTELLLYAADRAQHVEGMLKPLLKQGTIILCDRFTDSSVAYQGYGRGLDLHLIHQLNQIATNGLESDLTLWLDVDVKIGLARTQARGEADRMEKADLEFHRRVQQGFAELAQAYPHRIVRIDASRSVDEVTKTIQTTLIQRFPEWEKH